MLLLRFTCENHRSFKEEASLSLVSSALKVAHPLNDNWVDATVRVAGIYGPNASGKSNLLDALWFARRCIGSSATRWAEDDALPHRPFLLDSDLRMSPSTYVFEFVEDQVRYEYGFELAPEAIHSEWLYTFPMGRKRVLFERTQGKPIKFGRSFGRSSALDDMTTERRLLLSVGALASHKLLRRLHHALMAHIQFAQYSDSDRNARIKWIMRMLEDPELLHQATNLLRFADLGIAGVSIVDEGASLLDSDPRLRQALLAFAREYRSTDPEDPSSVEGVDELVGDALGQLKKTIRFSHGEGILGTLQLEDESSGTVAWLSLAMPALQALKSQKVLLVDELDASMHPRLTAALVAMFKDPRLNATGAQLIFTSHDATLLGPLAPVEMKPDEVWFCEKRLDGGSELLSLAEFTTRDGDNFERRYLQGRYGALPIISPDELVHALQSTPEEAAEAHA